MEIIKKQASQDELDYFLKYNMWPWSQEVIDLYTEAINRNKFIRTYSGDSVNYARKIYNQAAILQLLAIETKEGDFLISGVQINGGPKNDLEDLPSGYGDFGYESGLIKPNTLVDDKTVLIGKISYPKNNPTVVSDDSIFPKKGQLGFVDKTFITESEEGARLAKVRIREERMPNIGDKFASRAGQKGTVGVLIREQDMPFTSEGIRPDIIINPHAIPSRMTIGQLVETLIGKACVLYGAFGDCTAGSVGSIHWKIVPEKIVGKQNCWFQYV
jgi:hypothetical protein